LCWKPLLEWSLLSWGKNPLHPSFKKKNYIPWKLKNWLSWFHILTIKASTLSLFFMLLAQNARHFSSCNNPINSLINVESYKFPLNVCRTLPKLSKKVLNTFSTKFCASIAPPMLTSSNCIFSIFFQIFHYGAKIGLKCFHTNHINYVVWVHRLLFWSSSFIVDALCGCVRPLYDD
jgi:hypothetical protein